ncbi:NAD(P)-dependent oxidoreductase [Nonomuraea jiangxiensis]|uniref:D-3-phosphoglycerate dehydrogenase n=1 Tax=Nonomuraea jiangxiensis TaxID=633440 RepID=A0A1G8QJV0_9ACTN|nr:NAD(P)-dependent oxidoreductase [Nonomuraea jiangxiensis]SDJ04916.1 D-3-phosphoglycerate dehydrogenase [Nonomuraea jiangxiensis]
MSGAMRVVVTSRSFGSGTRKVADELAAAGTEVVRGPATHDLAELGPLLAEADGWIAGTGPITAAHLNAAPRLRVIARYGVGVDAVDLAAAARHGVTVTNTPGANTEAVADLALVLLLSAVRGVTEGDRRVRAGRWTPVRGREIASLRIGIAGLGQIGRAFARRAAALGCEVVGHDPYAPPGDIPRAPLAELAACDAVSLHASGGATLIDERWLAAVRPGLVLVNTARAGLVDEAAVAAALRDGRLGAYAADTLATESGGTSPLLDPELAGRVTLTPHIGAQTVQAIDRMGAAAAADVLAVLSGRPPLNPVPTEGK